MTVLPELEQQLVKAAGGTARIRRAPRRRFRGWTALALGCAAVGVVVLVFALVGSNRGHVTVSGHVPAARVDPSVPATYARACAATSDCVTVPPGPVPTALRRPFHLPRLTVGQRCPTTDGIRFSNSELGGVGLGNAPVRPVFGNRGGLLHGNVVLGRTEDPGWLGVKTVWYSQPSYTGPWSVRAARLTGRGRIDLGGEPASPTKPGGSRFSPTALVVPPGDTLNTGDGYRTDPRTTWITRPGCYAFEVDGLGFSELIVFNALAPAK
jgi:hypothetical protein